MGEKMSLEHKHNVLCLVLLNHVPNRVLGTRTITVDTANKKPHSYRV